MFNRALFVMLFMTLPEVAGAQFPQAGAIRLHALPGMQIEPVISNGRVMYKDFQAFAHQGFMVGPQLFIDSFDQSGALVGTAGRELAWDGHASYATFGSIDRGTVAFNSSAHDHPTYPGKFEGHQFSGELFSRTLEPAGAYWLPVEEIEPIVGHTMRAKTAVSRVGVTTRHFWMELNQKGDWDVVLSVHTVDPQAPTGWTRNYQRPGTDGINDLDPAVSLGIFAWAQHLAATNSYRVLAGWLTDPSGGGSVILQEVGSGRFPSLSRDGRVLVFERILPAGNSIIYEWDSFTPTIGPRPLQGLTPLDGCKSYHRPVISDDAKWVIHRGEGCVGYLDSMLLATNRGTGETYVIDKLSRFGSESEPAMYDVDLDGRVIYSRSNGNDEWDFELWTWRY